MNHIVLKKGKEKAIKNRHHWIFSGAVKTLPDFKDGEISQVFSDSDELLGSGYFNKKAKILGRMLCFDDSVALDAVKKSLDAALKWRKTLFSKSQTTGYRLINGEGDCLPGLIVDLYDKVAVIQISTLGMTHLKPFVIDYLKQNLDLESIYEKSNLPSRKEEGLKSEEGLLFGKDVDEVEILENGNKFIVGIKEGQKTGFFLDHREMREKIKHLSQGKKVLNCFSYSGGFSIYAAKGGATQVDSVDISEKAIALAKRNADLNGIEKGKLNFYAEDVFQFIREKEMNYDLVILDPPAFAKKQKDIIPACRGYKDINRVTMQKMPSNSLLLTCSCSYHVDETLFQKVLFQAAQEAGRVVQIIGRHQMAPDHPVNIYHPESDYLKSFLLHIE